MLELSDINLFAAPEAKVYRSDPEIVAMSRLRSSLEANDLEEFESILKDRKNRLSDEPLLMTYIQPLRRRMKEQVCKYLISWKFVVIISKFIGFHALFLFILIYLLFFTIHGLYIYVHLGFN